MTKFQFPKKSILTKEDLLNFLESDTFNRFMEFLMNLNDSVKNVSLLSSEYNRNNNNNNSNNNISNSHIDSNTNNIIACSSSSVQSLISLLNKLESLILDFSPEENDTSRFGNPSFRKWLDAAGPLIHDHLSSMDYMPIDAVIELGSYLYHSFGDKRRIDYGTGHEASFLCFLYCLNHVGLVSKADFTSLVIDLFWKYIHLMRQLQFTYWLEPAGSHGVWGLDDYHFLPFLFGSAQLLNHKYIRPKSIHQDEIVEEFSNHYMYLACISFINSVKSESLTWHSPMLNDISGVKTWAKVNEGMIKMYKAEVLAKLPIMQHFRFGSILSFEGSSFSLEKLSGPTDAATTAAGQQHIINSSEVSNESYSITKGWYDDQPVFGNTDSFSTGDDDGNNDQNEHVHVFAFGQEFPTCCGIRIPSAVAAAAIKGNNPNGMIVVKSTGPNSTLPFD